MRDTSVGGAARAIASQAGLAWRGVDGLLFRADDDGSNAGSDFGARFGPGDTVGCGLLVAERRAFFTKNGALTGEESSVPKPRRRNAGGGALPGRSPAPPGRLAQTLAANSSKAPVQAGVHPSCTVLHAPSTRPRPPRPPFTPSLQATCSLCRRWALMSSLPARCTRQGTSPKRVSRGHSSSTWPPSWKRGAALPWPGLPRDAPRHP